MTTTETTVRDQAIVRLAEIRHKLEEARQELEQLGDAVDAAYPGHARAPGGPQPDDAPCRDWANADALLGGSIDLLSDGMQTKFVALA